MDNIEDLFPCQIDSPEAMVALGTRIGALLKKGDILALIGDLGAGKTHLTQGVAKHFSYQGAVTSPTFNLIHEYPNTPLIHTDFYRLDQPAELLQIGWEDYLEREAILVIEWADRFPELIPAGSHWVKIQHQDKSRSLQYTLH